LNCDYKNTVFKQEDLITILVGRSDIVSEIKSTYKKLQTYIARSFADWLQNNNFINALPGLIAPDSVSQECFNWLIAKIITTAEV